MRILKRTTIATAPAQSDRSRYVQRPRRQGSAVLAPCAATRVPRSTTQNKGWLNPHWSERPGDWCAPRSALPTKHTAACQYASSSSSSSSPRQQCTSRTRPELPGQHQPQHRHRDTREYHRRQRPTRGPDLPTRQQNRPPGQQAARSPVAPNRETHTHTWKPNSPVSPPTAPARHTLRRQAHTVAQRFGARAG